MSQHPDALTLRRARELCAAVRDAADYTVVQLLSRTMPGGGRIEALVVDVECDGVPSRNPAGIQYRERLALLVPEDPGALVEVLALRKSFPVLMHQNHGTRDGAASLCLYFEPTPTVTEDMDAHNGSCVASSGGWSKAPRANCTRLTNPLRTCSSRPSSSSFCHGTSTRSGRPTA